MSDSRFSPDDFMSPGSDWRGKPFWSWNGVLDKDELIRQIHILKEMGMGGYFMHSRTGLVTEYLGEDWFDLTNACAEEGARLGLESWLYDEDRWPSGTAGGMVTANPEYRMKLIHMARFDGETFDLAAWANEHDRPLGAWSCRIEDEIDIFDVRPVKLDSLQSELAGRSVLAFRIIPMGEGSFYNGNTYVDTMKRSATDEYIRLTHEAYKEHCGHHFGNAIKGIFTDEPHRGPFMSGFGILAEDGVNLTDLVPWTDAIFDLFAAAHGYHVEEKLPELFLRLDGKAVSQVKAHYVDSLLELFLENFARPYYDWCDQNNLLVTGHVLHENSLSCQVSTNGSVQRYYPLMHVPGIDYLCEHGRDYWVAKQVDSTARQFGQKWILSELYGCTGWQMNFESHKAVGAWQTLFGVNLRCHHLSWYTMAGEAKRDYPASILHQSPWYKEYNTVETWFSRFGYFRSQGEPCCDLLVLNPVESVWGRVYPGAISGMSARDEGIKHLEESYANLFHILAGNQIDFDYGDEALLASAAQVSNASGTPVLRLGDMKYTTMLVAGLETIRSSTLELIRKFIDAGGRIIFAGDSPAYVDSVPSDAVKELVDEAIACRNIEGDIIDMLRGHTPYEVAITDTVKGAVNHDIFCQLRKAEETFFLSVLNTSRDVVHDITIMVRGLGAYCVEEWDLDTGTPAQIKTNGTGSLVFSSTLHTSQARCFRLVKESEIELSLPCTSAISFTRKINADQSYTYTLADKNICVLDAPIWSVDDGQPQPANDILRVDRLVRQHYGKPVRAGDMVQPWFRGKETFPELGVVTLHYPFNIEANSLVLMDSVELALEDPQSVDITLNGHPIKTDADCGWWIDIAFRRIILPKALFVEGKNQLTVTCRFREDINLEAIYLLGDFAVTLDGITPILRPLPERLLPTSIVDQGLPYYSGSLTYHCTVPDEYVTKQCKVLIPDYEAAYVRVASGDETRMIPWRPNETWINLGKSLDIEVCITRKNTFGPLHLNNPRPAGTGPHCFVPGPDQFSLEPVFIESGLLAPVELYIAED